MSSSSAAATRGPRSPPSCPERIGACWRARRSTRSRCDTAPCRLASAFASSGSSGIASRVDTRLGRKLGRSCRQGPLIRTRAKDLEAAGVERAQSRACGTAFCWRTIASSMCERRLVHRSDGFPRIDLPGVRRRRGAAALPRSRIGARAGFLGLIFQCSFSSDVLRSRGHAETSRNTSRRADQDSSQRSLRRPKRRRIRPPLRVAPTGDVAVTLFGTSGFRRPR